ncbi:MAG: hypothetical protein HY305_05320, partial [Sphingobacteriales bacterium]|nr:hypothetical protein [Sphingobacteriales bacterium]
MKYLLVLCTCMVSLSGFSQSKKISFKLGSEYELPKRAADLAFFGNAQDGIVNLALKKDNLSITRFDPSTLNQTNGKEIQLAEATKYFVSEKVIDFGNKYFWIHSDWDKDAGKEFLYYDQIDVLSGKIASSNNKMLETTKMTREAAPSLAGGMFSFLGTGSKYNLNTDVANKKLLVSYRLVPEEKKDKN